MDRFTGLFTGFAISTLILSSGCNQNNVDSDISKRNDRNVPHNYDSTSLKNGRAELDHVDFTISEFKSESRIDMIPLQEKHCNGNQIEFFDIIDNEEFRIRVTKKPFVESNHSLSYSKENKEILEKIDGKFPIGSDGSIPKNSLLSIELFINDRWFNVRADSLNNIYNVPSCSDVEYSFSGQNIEAYYSQKFQIIYLYFLGGTESAGYAVKFAFSKSQCLFREIKRDSNYDNLDGMDTPDVF
jgi:hypothetical protein